MFICCRSGTLARKMSFSAFPYTLAKVEVGAGAEGLIPAWAAVRPNAAMQRLWHALRVWRVGKTRREVVWGEVGWGMLCLVARIAP